MNDSAAAKRQFPVIIDEAQYMNDDPVITGRQLLDLAEKRPVEEHLVYQVGRDSLLEDIGLEESVDLREPGIERFITFKSDRSYRFELDGRRQDWGAPTISETTLRKFTGIADDYNVWQERQAQEDLLLPKGAFIALTGEGVERFYTGRDTSTSGAIDFLPQEDRRYLSEQSYAAEALVQGSQKGLVLTKFPLPAGRYTSEVADILIVLPSGYPDAPPDMFFTDPWLKLVPSNRLPQSADQTFSFAGRKWQQWSRHNNSWRPGVDGIRTMLRRIDCALRSAS